MYYPKKLSILFNIFVYGVVKMVCLNLDKRVLDAYIRVTVNKSIDKCT